MGIILAKVIRLKCLVKEICGWHDLASRVKTVSIHPPVLMAIRLQKEEKSDTKKSDGE